jgi:hypothetical protein
MLLIFMKAVSNRKEYFCEYYFYFIQSLLMKLRISQSFLFGLLIMFSACTKELSRENKINTNTNGDFYSTIGTTRWNADSLQLTVVSASGVAINGLSKTGDQISIMLPAFQTGTFILNDTSLSYALFGNLFDSIPAVYETNFGTGGGTVTISSIDTVNHLLSGTFKLTLVNPVDNSAKVITAGVFSSIPYNGTTGTALPGDGKDTLQALVNGNQFVSAQIEASISMGQLLIAGISSDGISDLALIMPDNVLSGSYSMDYATGVYFGIYYPSQGTVLASNNNGTLTIISNNTTTKRIIGTFSFVGSPFTSGSTATITNGYFSLTYQ